MAVPAIHRSSLIDNGLSLDPDMIWVFRSTLHTIRVSGPGARTSIDNALALSSELYLFINSVKRGLSSAEFSQLARTLHAGGDILIAIEEAATHEDVTIPEMLADGLFVILSFAGNTGYISSSLEEVRRTVDEHILLLSDRLWALAESGGPRKSGEMAGAIGRFFASVRGLDLAGKVAALAGLYRVLMTIAVNDVVRSVEWDE